MVNWMLQSPGPVVRPLSSTMLVMLYWPAAAPLWISCTMIPVSAAIFTTAPTVRLACPRLP